jgi:tetratricopeptide (TPR) repeat protein
MVADVERANRKTPNSLAAYECVLKGNSLPWTEPQGAAEATRLFAKAIEIDPSYGMAHASLACKYLDAWKHGLTESGALLDEAGKLAQRATALDGNEGTCFSVLALVNLHLRAFESAQQNIHHAIELNPNNQWNSGDMGIIQMFLGHADAALEYFKLAKAIDPFFAPPWYFMSMGLAHMLQCQFAEALAAFALFPVQNYELSALTAGCHAQLSDSSTAAFHAQQCLDLRPGFTIRHYLSKQPFKIEADRMAMAETLRIAGLPE